MTLMKVIGNEITSLKIISAKAETTEIKLRTVSKHEMFLIKVIGNEKTSLKIILAQAETAETTEIMLRTVSKHKMALIKDIGNGGDEAKKCGIIKRGPKMASDLLYEPPFKRYCQNIIIFIFGHI